MAPSLCKASIAAFEDEHHRITTSDAEAMQVRSSEVRPPFQFTERECALLSFLIGPQQGALVGIFFGPCVHHVVGKVEMLGYAYLIVLHKVVE